MFNIWLIMVIKWISNNGGTEMDGWFISSIKSQSKMDDDSGTSHDLGNLHTTLYVFQYRSLRSVTIHTMMSFYNSSQTSMMFTWLETIRFLAFFAIRLVWFFKSSMKSHDTTIESSSKSLFNRSPLLICINHNIIHRCPKFPLVGW